MPESTIILHFIHSEVISGYNPTVHCCDVKHPYHSSFIMNLKVTTCTKLTNWNHEFGTQSKIIVKHYATVSHTSTCSINYN